MNLKNVMILVFGAVFASGMAFAADGVPEVRFTVDTRALKTARAGEELAIYYEKNETVTMTVPDGTVTTLVEGEEFVEGEEKTGSVTWKVPSASGAYTLSAGGKTAVCVVEGDPYITEIRFVADTRTLKTASADEKIAISYAKGETVTVTEPDGIVTPLVKDAAEAGTVIWKVPSASGVYMLADGERTAVLVAEGDPETVLIDVDTRTLKRVSAGETLAITYKKGETVTMTDEKGGVMTLVTGAAEDGAVRWTAPSASGVYTVSAGGRTEVFVVEGEPIDTEVRFDADTRSEKTAQIYDTFELAYGGSGTVTVTDPDGNETTLVEGATGADSVVWTVPAKDGLYALTYEPGAGDKLTATYRVSETTRVIPDVDATVEFTYDGTEKRPVAAAGYYLLSGDVCATNAGSYTVCVTPAEGCTWKDGSATTTNIAWTIVKSGEMVGEDAYMQVEDGNCTIFGTGSATALPNGLDRNSIKSVTVGDGITEIGSRFFKRCLYLNTVTFGKDVKKVGEKAFLYCMSLETIKIDNPDFDLSSLDGAINYHTAVKPDGSLYPIPNVTVTGYQQTLEGKENLTDANWTDLGPVVPGKAMENYGGYHFFRIVLKKIEE